MNVMHFANSRRSTLGIEWELALVDPVTGDLVGRGAEVVEAAANQHIAGEFLTNTVELVTGVCDTVPAATAELRQLRDELMVTLDRLGIGVIGTGAHPWADWQLQTLAPDDRYLRVVDRARQWGRQLSIWGLHIHVGLTSRDHVVPAMHAVLTDLPLMLALTASSPFWEGKDTGFASHRSMLFQQLPSAGLPPRLDDWRELDRTVSGMLASGALLDERELRWDVRPAGRFGTLEVRVFDAPSTVTEVGAAAAFVQCVVEETVRALERGRPLRALPEWAVIENKFRAARYGLDTEFIINADGGLEPGRDLMARRIDELLPIANDLGCDSKLVNSLAVAESNGADHQRSLMRTHSRSGMIEAMRAALRQ